MDSLGAALARLETVTAAQWPRAQFSSVLHDGEQPRKGAAMKTYMTALRLALSSSKVRPVCRPLRV